MKLFSKQIIMLIVIGSTLFITSFGYSNQDTIVFGIYDEYTYLVIERTRKIPKNTTPGVTIRIGKKFEGSYKLVLLMPKPVKELQVFDMGEWKKLRQGRSVTGSIPDKSATHVLKGRIYTIKGDVSTLDTGGTYVRGVYKGENLPLGKYNLGIFFKNKLIRTINFRIVAAKYY